MEMTATGLFLSLLVSSVGVGFFIYGKKQNRIPPLVSGLLLLVYPYFVADTWIMLGIGVGILASLWLAVRFGA